MKRLTAPLLILFLLVGLAACSSSPASQESEPPRTELPSLTAVTRMTETGTSLSMTTVTVPPATEVTSSSSPNPTRTVTLPSVTSKAATAPATAPPVTEAFFEADFEKQVLALVNAERKKAGLNPLTASSGLAEAARLRAVELIEIFDHQRPDGSAYFTAVKIPYLAVGENAALGQSSPQEVMRGWMESKGHRENLLHPDWTHLGVGCWHDSRQAGSFFWIQLFALIPSPEEYHQEAYDQELVRLINEARKARDLAPLVITETLHTFAKDQAVHYSSHRKLQDLPAGLSTAFNTVISGSAGEYAFDTPAKVAARLQAIYGDQLFSGEYTQVGVGYYHSWQGDGIHWWGIVLAAPRD